MPAPLFVNFIADPLAASQQAWMVESTTTLVGDGLPDATTIDVVEAPFAEVPAGRWTLRGATGNLRYTTRDEKAELSAVQAPLARPEARCAALIPIRKNAAWWDLAQDERRDIIEEQSKHIRIGLAFLPEVARRLHHCRELNEPFDFLTWFEFAPEHRERFDDLLAELRATPEWNYVDREIDIRLIRR
jgi:hypothetical protein